MAPSASSTSSRSPCTSAWRCSSARRKRSSASPPTTTRPDAMQPWQPLLDWWFGAPAAPGERAARQNGLWFGYRPEQDAEARERFGGSVEQALCGELHWATEPHGWLAELICLDQLTRMIHRGTPAAFAGDARAQALLDVGLRRGWDRQLS